MAWTKPFSEISKADAAIAGGKGASLGEMTQAGIPVPPGFVILSSAFEHFLEETDLSVEIDAALESVNPKEMHTVEHASEKIQALILGASMPTDIAREIRESYTALNSPYVAVRSSATAEDSASAAWAGQLDSYLNTTSDSLLVNVQRCFASLFTPRAIFYRFEKELHTQKISVAVVVQKMVASEVSGIAFSVHPVTEDHNQLIIEAGYGLGEAIVSGSITPDSYVVEKKPRRTIDTNVSTQARALYRVDSGGNEWRDIPEPQASSQVLTEEHILELSELIINIENHYGFPCDIEWAYEDGTFYIVQSRPITTLVGNGEPKQLFKKAYTRNFSIIMQEAWFAGNKDGFIQKLGLEEYPYDPPYIYFMKDGVEEVWENAQANRWLLEKLVEKFESDKTFFPNVYEHYFENLKEIEVLQTKGISTLEDLKIFIDRVYRGVSDFVILYGALLHESVATEYKSEALKFREKDSFFADCNVALVKALKNLYPQLGYLVVYLTREELGNSVDRAVLEKRDKGFALIPGIYQGEGSFEELKNKFPNFRFDEEKIGDISSELKGQSAYRGKVSGRVRIVKRTDQAEMVAEGEVIVSPMTTPDFAPAMKKAIAFVTDEGGITCHAAIIARELSKPCIIGTKVATQVLHDGDLVEVDADSGVVRILERMGEIQDIPDINDFEKTFESAGTTFLFEDLVDEVYNPEGTVSLFQNGIKTVYTSNKREEQMREEGLQITPEVLRQKGQDIATLITRLIEEVNEYRNKKDFSRGDVAHMIEQLSLFARDYYYFDLSFWDSAFRESQKGDEKSTQKVHIVQEFKNKIRADVDPVFFDRSGYFFTLITEIAKHTSVPEEEIMNYRVRELAPLFDGERVSTTELARRARAYVFDKYARDESRFFSGDQAEAFAKKFYPATSPIKTSEGNLVGKVAHKGRGGNVTGPVRIMIRDYASKDKFKQTMETVEAGSIIVAPTTDPEMMPALRKAGAIITDIGGLLSHSAITSRELNIPCIIGTKVATQVLHDGDLVEVDVEKGVVRILK